MRRMGLALLLVVTLAACSGSSPTPTPSPSASPSPSPSLSPSPSPTPSASPRPSPSPDPRPTAGAHPRLTGDGIDLPSGVLVFGAPFATAGPALQRWLGRPTRDTGPIQSAGSYGTCPGTRLRALEYAGGALVILFGDVKGPGLTMYQWALQPAGDARKVPQASAFIGDVTTYDFGIGTTLGRLRAAVPREMLIVTPAQGSRAPTFRLRDQSSGFLGQLSGTTDSDATTYVEAGRPCGD